MKIYTETGGNVACDLAGVLRRMGELGATEKEQTWTARWVTVVKRWCEGLQRPLDRAAGVDWLRVNAAPKDDAAAVWKQEQARGALATYFHLTGQAVTCVKPKAASSEVGGGGMGAAGGGGGRVVEAKAGPELVKAAGGANSQGGTERGPMPATETEGAGGRAGTWEEAGGRLKGYLDCKSYAAKTRECYVGWARRFYRWCTGRKVPMAGVEAGVLRDFLEDLAGTGVTAKTQNQALNALVCFFRHGVGEEPGNIGEYLRARTSRRLPVVLNRGEAGTVMRDMKARGGQMWLVAGMMLGAGLRQREVLELRVKDVDLERGVITVRQGKGNKDRITMLPQLVKQGLEDHLSLRRAEYERDLAEGAGFVPLPDGLERKKPGAARAWGWQYLFGGQNVIVERVTGRMIRWHVHEKTVGRMLGEAARRCGVTRAVTCHSLRHTFATLALESGTDIRTLQELLGHADVSTTMIYTHVLNRAGVATRSPLDALAVA